MFVPGNPLQPSLMFADKARAYPSEPSFRYSTNIVRSWPYAQTFNRLEKLARNKHSSLAQKSVNHGQKSFTTLRPGGGGVDQL